MANLWRQAAAALITAVPAKNYITKDADTPTFTDYRSDWETRLARAENAVERYMKEYGIPGISIGVSVNGNTIFKSGVGLADIEQHVPCTENTVMRIASVGKPITAAFIMLLAEEGIIDLDAPIQTYVPSFPIKTFQGNVVDITCWNLLCHASGIRHYKTTTTTDPEFTMNQEFPTAVSAVELFKDDELVAKPGTYSYSTFGYTLLNAVIDSLPEINYKTFLQCFTGYLGMTETYLDECDKIIPNRARFYRTTKSGKLENVPEINCSYKWAGGGLLSSVSDLLIFGNAMLYSYQNMINNYDSNNTLLKSETTEVMFKSTVLAKKNPDLWYALGWMVNKDEPSVTGAGIGRHGYFYHTGAAVGASSILLIRPGQYADENGPNGCVISILANKQDVGSGLVNLACEISELFDCELIKP